MLVLLKDILTFLCSAEIGNLANQWVLICECFYISGSVTVSVVVVVTVL